MSSNFVRFHKILSITIGKNFSYLSHEEPVNLLAKLAQGDLVFLILKHFKSVFNSKQGWFKNCMRDLCH